MPHILENPIWNALTTHHEPLAIGGDLARRYPAKIGPLCGLKQQSDDTYQALKQLLKKGEKAVLFLDQPLQAPDDWTVEINTGLVQMVLDNQPEITMSDPVVPLTDNDIPEMISLTRLTKPGPFEERTIDYGGYIGIKKDSKLAAMAGYRTHLTGYTEISAVCTHPDYQGRGYAKQLLTACAKSITNRGETPYLHTWAHNHGAIRVYESLGFRHRPQLTVVVIQPT